MIKSKLNLDDFNFSTKIRNAFKNNHIQTVDNLCQISPREIMKFRNLGAKSIDEIVIKLSKFGLVLAPYIPKRRKYAFKSAWAWMDVKKGDVIIDKLYSERKSLIDANFGMEGWPICVEIKWLKK